MQVTEKTQTRAAHLQKECLEMVNELFPRIKKRMGFWKVIQAMYRGHYGKFNACQTTWLLLKVAELELKIEQLEKQIK